MFRVYSIKEKKWMRDNIYLSPYLNDLYTYKRNIFGRKKLKLESIDDYVIHKNSGLFDKYESSIYEGDYVKCQVSENKVVIGLVVFAPELAAYIILCDDTNEWFSLGSEVLEHVQVIGNVFDGYEDTEE